MQPSLPATCTKLASHQLMYAQCNTSTLLPHLPTPHLAVVVFWALDDGGGVGTIEALDALLEGADAHIGARVAQQGLAQDVDVHPYTLGLVAV